MSNRPTDTGNDGDARFDEALRGHHAASMERLSPRTRAQLVESKDVV